MSESTPFPKVAVLAAWGLLPVDVNDLDRLGVDRQHASGLIRGNSLLA